MKDSQFQFTNNFGNRQRTSVVWDFIFRASTVAGIVALILLASTANAIVTERSRDAAIMRAVGGTRRAVRKDLRRLAIIIGAVGTVFGNHGINTLVCFLYA